MNTLSKIIFNNRLNRIYQRDGKNTFGGFIAMGIDIEGEQGNIANRDREPNGSDQFLLSIMKIFKATLNRTENLTK